VGDRSVRQSDSGPTTGTYYRKPDLSRVEPSKVGTPPDDLVFKNIWLSAKPNRKKQLFVRKVEGGGRGRAVQQGTGPSKRRGSETARFKKADSKGTRNRFCRREDEGRIAIGKNSTSTVRSPRSRRNGDEKEEASSERVGRRTLRPGGKGRARHILWFNFWKP